MKTLHGEFQDPTIHEAWKSTYRKSVHATFNEAIMTRVVRNMALRPNASILDAGCGTGEHTLGLAQRGFFCTGVDVSEYVIDEAKRKACERGLADRTTFIRMGLEDLTNISEQFDGVHCRGVLMHIPSWKTALRELCKVLKDRGRIAILESNTQAVETKIVTLLRRYRRNKSRTILTDGGLEFWNETENGAPLTRIAHIATLAEELKLNDVQPVLRTATQFWDVNRFPQGVARRGALQFNRTWFRLGLPARLSSGNLIIGEKRRGVVSANETEFSRERRLGGQEY